MRYWRSGAKKTHRVRAFILKGGRRVSSMRVSSPGGVRQEKGSPKTQEEAEGPALAA